MAFGRRKQGQQQSEERGGGRRRFVGREELMRFFVSFANTAEEVVLKRAVIEEAIDAGSRKDIERATDDVAFRIALTQIRTQIGNGLREKSEETKLDWYGPFDGWFKQYAQESYGPDADFAKEHGTNEDWVGKMIYVVLPGQVSKHNVLARWAEFVGMELVETRKGFQPIYEAVIKKMKEGAPTSRGTMSAAEYLEKKVKYDETLGYFRRTRRDVEDWLKGKKEAGESAAPPADPKQQLRESVVEDIMRLAELRKQLTEQTNSGADLAVLNGIMGSLKEVNVRIRESEAKLKELESSKPVGANERLQRAANIVASEPVIPSEPTGGKPTVSGDATAAKAKASDTDAKVEALKADIARFVIEMRQHEAAVEAKEAEAVKKSQEGRAEADDEKAEALLREARTLRQGAKASAETAEKLRKRISELNTEIKEYTKAAAKSPDEKKSKRKSNAAPTGTVVTPPAEAKTPAPQAQASDAPPKPTGDLKEDLAAQIAYWGEKGNTAMVEALTPALKALGG